MMGLNRKGHYAANRHVSWENKPSSWAYRVFAGQSWGRATARENPMVLTATLNGLGIRACRNITTDQTHGVETNAINDDVVVARGQNQI